MPEPPILVTGAAGGAQGKTGRLVTQSLLNDGHKVRAFVRKHDERSEHLQHLGAEVFVGDLLEVESVRKACVGVRAVYFAYPVQEGLLEACAMMATAARDAGVKRLVNLMMLTSDPKAPTPRMRQNYMAEQILGWADIGAVHLRAAVFYENLYALVARALSTTDSIQLPWGEDTTILPLVSAQDVARVATELLLIPDLPSGSSFRLLGAGLDVRAIVATLSHVLAKDIHYKNIPDEQWRKMALEDGANAHAVEHLSHLWRFLRSQSEHQSRERFQITTETYERFGHFQPRSLEDFLIQKRMELNGERSKALGLTVQ